MSLKLLLCDILKMISHNNFKCGSITFHKKKKQLAKYQQLGISLLRNNLTQFYVFTLSIPASVVLVCYYFWLLPASMYLKLVLIKQSACIVFVLITYFFAEFHYILQRFSIRYQKFMFIKNLIENPFM